MWGRSIYHSQDSCLKMRLRLYNQGHIFMLLGSVRVSMVSSYRNHYRISETYSDICPDRQTSMPAARGQSNPSPQQHSSCRRRCRHLAGAWVPLALPHHPPPASPTALGRAQCRSNASGRASAEKLGPRSGPTCPSTK